MAQSIATLAKGDRFEGALLIKQAQVRVSQNGSKYLDVTLCDKTGEINAKAWDWGENPAPEAMSVMSVRGQVSEYMGKLQMKIELLTKADVSRANLASLIPCAPRTPDDMLADIYAAIDDMTIDDFKLLTAAVVDENKEKLRIYPAATALHHSERGGLLHHVTGMLAAARALLPVYPFLCPDILLCGVIVHDICKLRELSASDLGLASEYTVEGQLLGHITIGVSYIGSVCERLGVSEEVKLIVQHMVLSHHNEPDFGSPRRPMFPEAEVLHHLDTMDARMFDMHKNLSQLQPGGMTGYIRSLDNRKLYRHSYFTGE